MSTIIAYWLLPAEAARHFFSETIAELASRFGAPEFAPHLTLLTAPESSRAPDDVVAEVGAVAIELQPVEVSASEQFTKTLFVRFEKTAALEQLHARVAKLSGTPDHHLDDPHLSLLYHYLPEMTRTELAALITPPFREVPFRSLCAVRCASPTQSAAAVRAWQMLAAQNSKTR